jgi:REP element-mobilizing transposase RayT
MPRPPRIFVDGAIYHVYCRAARGEPVFADDAEALDFVDTLAEIKQRDDLQVLAWCVMSNHYHIVVRSATVPLWRTMRLVQGRYAKAHNARHRTFGPVWQGRYRARLVTGEAHLAQVIAYVHLNPVAAGAVRDPKDWRWSGHRELLGSAADPLIDADASLAAFGDPVDAAMRTYLRTLAELSRKPWIERAPGALPWWSVGRPPEASARPERPLVDARGASTAAERPRLTADELLDLAAVASGTTATELRSPRSGSGLTRRRELVALVAVEQFGVRVKDLAAALGRDQSCVSRWVNAAGDRRAGDPAYRRSAEELAAAIAGAARAAHAARSGFVYNL